jgi:FkbM family methyltransferase
LSRNRDREKRQRSNFLQREIRLDYPSQPVFLRQTVPPQASYANCQEDLEVLAFFGSEAGTFVEAGANHPVKCSQTYLLEQKGWRGVLIEPNPELAKLCRELRPSSRTFACALVEPGGPDKVRMRIPGRSSAAAAIVETSTKVLDEDAFIECPARTLDKVLQESGIERMDYFSIDLEGYEVKALMGFSWKRWRPRLLSIEDHCENLDTHRYVSAQGYRLVRRIGDNHWYVPSDTPFPVSFADRLEFVRKLYLSSPFRKLRRLLRGLRGRNPD